MGRMSRDERLAQAEECLASGMTVKDWCAANGVPAATMYVWVRRLREERECALAPAFVELGTIAPCGTPRPRPACRSSCAWAAWRYSSRQAPASERCRWP